MRAKSALVAGTLGVVAGACVALMQGRRVPPELRPEMIASAESFIVAQIAAADLVSEGLGIERRDPARAAEMFDRAEAAILALEPKIIRLGLVFGQDSSVKEKALECSMNLHIFLMWVRDRERVPPDAGEGFSRGADALHALKAAASAEIRRTRPPLKTLESEGWSVEPKRYRPGWLPDFLAVKDRRRALVAPVLAVRGSPASVERTAARVMADDPAVDRRVIVVPDVSPHEPSLETEPLIVKIRKLIPALTRNLLGGDS